MSCWDSTRPINISWDSSLRAPRDCACYSRQSAHARRPHEAATGSTALTAAYASPSAQRLVTPTMLQRKRHTLAIKKNRQIKVRPHSAPRSNDDEFARGRATASPPPRPHCYPSWWRTAASRRECFGLSCHRPTLQKHGSPLMRRPVLIRRPRPSRLTTRSCSPSARRSCATRKWRRSRSAAPPARAAQARSRRSVGFLHLALSPYVR